MNRRWTVLGVAAVLSLCAPTVPALATNMEAQVRGVRTDDDAALNRLKADARGAVRVHRGAGGRVDHLTSADGSAILMPRGASTPTRAAVDQLARHGEVFGLDGERSRAEVRSTIPSLTGGTVVRADQVVDGVPVFGGQVVMSLDAKQGVVSVEAATTDPVDVPLPVVTEARAERAAAGFVAKTHGVPVQDLVVTGMGRQLYDPAVVHVVDAGGARPVWRFEVSDGHRIRETVLVGTGRGEIALHFNDVPDVNRVVCDNAGDQSVYSDDVVPLCATPARTEGAGTTGTLDVDAAYDHLGAVSDAYTGLGGIDLTDVVGVGASGSKELRATVRWCFADVGCPLANAFWDGRQIVFGAGYAAADDVVGHELTHGYVERTAGLFYLHQSGALNESLSDVIGEVVDHRNGTEDDSAWTIGEDLPDGGALRSLANPALFDQPDRMTSPLFQSGDAFDDNGAVHANDGVGNKTAHLISQGGTFNGHTVTGIDGADAGLTRTGRLFLEVIPRLTSGSEYADLGRVLAGTCDQLAASATGGFTTGHCASVRAAVAATELEQAPTDPNAAAPEIAAVCPQTRTLLPWARDDDQHDDFAWQLGTLWQRTPAGGTPAYAHSGTSSLFAWNPDPAGYGDPKSSDAVSRSFWLPPDEPVYLHLHHAHLFEYSPAQGTTPATYYDGGQVLIQARDSSGDWVTQTGLPWVNGPDQDVVSSDAPAFAGDSHGYGSSRVDLTGLAGREVRVVLRVVGDNTGSFLGWWVDDLQIYDCAARAPSAPRNLRVKAGMSTAVISWDPPSDPGSGPLGYRVHSLNNINAALPGTSRSYVYRKPSWVGEAMPLNFVATAPVSAHSWLQSPAASITVYETAVTGRTFAVRGARKGRYFRYRAIVTRAPFETVAVPDRPVQLFRSRSKAGPWRLVSTRTTTRGRATWRVKQSRPTYYRIVVPGKDNYFGNSSRPHLVRMR